MPVRVTHFTNPSHRHNLMHKIRRTGGSTKLASKWDALPDKTRMRHYGRTMNKLENFLDDKYRVFEDATFTNKKFLRPTRMAEKRVESPRRVYRRARRVRRDV